MTAPSKYLPEEEWTVEDFLHRARTGERPINPEWIDSRRKVLHAAGLEDVDEMPSDREES